MVVWVTRLCLLVWKMSRMLLSNDDAKELRRERHGGGGRKTDTFN